MKNRFFFLSILVLLACRIEIASAKDEVRILVLLSLDITYPYVKSKVDGLAFEGTRNQKTVLLDIQSLEDKRFTDADKLHHYYRKKAEQLKISNPDAIAISGSPVIFSFYNKYLYPLMPDVPMVGETRIVPEEHKPDAYSFIEYHQNIPKTIDMALELTDPKTIYLIGDATHSGSRLSMKLVKDYLHRVTDIKIEFLNMPFQDLQKTAKTLPKDAIGFYNLIFSDGLGNLILPKHALKIIADQVPFPIFAFHDSLIGSGATGGLVTKGEDVGIQIIQETLLALDKGPFNPPRIVPAKSSIIFDRSYMDRFNIVRSKLPENAEIINTTPSLMDKYKIEIIVFTLIIFIMAFMLTLLFYYYRQKEMFVAKLSIINKELEHRIDARTINLKKANETLQRKELEITKLMLADALTGLPNRRHFDNEYQREFNRSKRTGSDFCIALCDIDYFKLVNDAYGHDIGDNVLVSIAKCISDTVRKTDFAARWGGEEFIIIYIDSDRSAAEYFSERIRLAIENLNFKDVEKNMTISIGLAQRKKEDTLTDVLKRADQALYQSKSEGRNCINFK
ncbi:MAG: GGDEF domain-containing protein [gamma proteobacterium symbiont of Taylorina sp.]|nr:GGDEF domain-containing protein [gamma proteobacterium symbiont of Taylorina sp.]